MPLPIVSDEEFIKIWLATKSPVKIAEKLGMTLRPLMRRRRAIEKRHGILLAAGAVPAISMIEQAPLNVRRGIDIEKGTVIVFSDAHFMPDEITPAYKFLLQCIKEMKPSVIVCNGDAFDGGCISRFPRIGWDKKPTVAEELKACKEMLEGIEEAARGAQLIWTMGNHDGRFETFLAAQAPQYEGVSGFSLSDHFPLWKGCWSYWIGDHTVIKHRHKGGRNAGYANVQAAMKNMVTGHTHVLAVQPISSYGGTLYGVQTGTLADVNGAQFADYTEDAPKDWRSGFAILNFDKGRLLQPELAVVCGETEVEFRGKIHEV
jgi:predicted phosphodiesterase